MSREEMEAMDRYYCVCGDTFSTRPELEAHCGCLPGVHVEDEEYADASQASPDAPGDAQAHVPDQMPETAPAEPQSADKSVGVPTRQYGTVRLPTQSVTFTDATIPAVVQDAQRYDRRSDPRANGALAALTAYRKERGL